MAVWSSSLAHGQRPNTISIPASVGSSSSEAPAHSWKSPEVVDASVPLLPSTSADGMALTYEQRVCRKHWHCLHVERQNLLQACRVAVKALVDRVCFAVVDDDSVELAQFIAVAERILFHGFHGQESGSILSAEEPCPELWPVLKAALPATEPVETVENMSDVHTDLGKCRAWLRTCLVQKSFATHYLQMLNSTQLISSCYSTSALLRREDGHLIFGFLQALDSVDFCLCLKDNVDLDVSVHSVVDYSYFIQFRASAIGNLADEGEWWDALEADSLPNVPRDSQSALANSVVVAAMSKGTSTVSSASACADRPDETLPNPDAVFSSSPRATSMTEGESTAAQTTAETASLNPGLSAGEEQVDGQPTVTTPNASVGSTTAASSLSADEGAASRHADQAAADSTKRSGSHPVSSSSGLNIASAGESTTGTDHVGMADFIRLQHHVSREREQRNYCEELVKQRARQLSEAAHEKEALLHRISAVQEQGHKELDQLEAIILELHEQVADLTLENRRLTQELTAASTPSDGIFSGFFSR
ncbi:uncharacterized protein LOC135821341 [Sycon ciliatum]|uniref:uncharacterized protein LOC135821341 n=1 Tax=Sycon ciliatum TaxID=27933 RepID=UPI0020A9E0AE|eukprot:scpid55774/ scgid32091/ RUN domain-containing protein 3B